MDRGLWRIVARAAEHEPGVGRRGDGRAVSLGDGGVPACKTIIGRNCSRHTPCAVRQLRHTPCAVRQLRHTACAYYFAGAARGRWIGLTTAALYAVSLYQVRLAWEIRMYTLGTALVALSSWLLFRALAAQTQHYRAWAAYGLVALAFVYTHHFAWFSIFGQAVFVAGFALAKSRGRVLAALKGPYVRHALAAYSIVALGWAPWLPTFLHQERQVLDDWWSLPVSLRDVTWVCYNMFFNTELDGLKEGPAAIVACACAVLLLWLLVKVRVGAWYFACRLAAKGRLGEWYVLAATVLPFSAVCFVSVVGRNVVVSRYFAFVQPFVLAAIAVLLSRIPNRPLRNWVAAMLVVTALGVHLDFVDSLEIDKKPGRGRRRLTSTPSGGRTNR